MSPIKQSSRCKAKMKTILWCGYCICVCCLAIVARTIATEEEIASSRETIPTVATGTTTTTSTDSVHEETIVQHNVNSDNNHLHDRIMETPDVTTSLRDAVVEAVMEVHEDSNLRKEDQNKNDTKQQDGKVWGSATSASSTHIPQNAPDLESMDEEVENVRRNHSKESNAETIEVHDETERIEQTEVKALHGEAKVTEGMHNEVLESADISNTSKESIDEIPMAPKSDSIRRWGAGGASHGVESDDSQSQQHQQNYRSNHQQQQQPHNDTLSSHIPFIRHNNMNHIHPPEGYTLTARVYIDKDDRLAHLDTDVTLPYFNCGAAGSTTAALPIKHAYFRHSLSAPTAWSNENALGSGGGLGGAPHPVLAIALRPYTLEVTSGETLDIHAGDVILLEDGLRPGHILRPSSSGHHDLTVLFLTLPQTYHHIGKERLSIHKATTRRANVDAGCPERHIVESFGEINGDATNSSNKTSFVESNPPMYSYDPVVIRVRRIVLGVMALSLSTLTADFLGKTAPLWLAVGVGGVCFVIGGTVGLTFVAENIWSALDLWRERRRLEQQQQQQHGQELQQQPPPPPSKQQQDEITEQPKDQQVKAE